MRRFDRLHKSVQRRVSALIERLEALDDPRAIGEALHGDLKEYWKYRAGDWRVIASIHDRTLTIEAIEIAHRSDAY